MQSSRPTPLGSSTPERSPRVWERPALTSLPPLTELTLQTGGGIPGGIGSAQDSDTSYQTVYAGVDDVDGTLKKAESLGAKTVVPTMQIPNGPTIALFADPQGHTFGLVKPQPM